MTDIVERLRAPAYWFSGSSEGHEGENSAPYEAADEIERMISGVVMMESAMSQQIKTIWRLRAALLDIRDMGPMTVDDQRWRIAKEALEGK